MRALALAALLLPCAAAQSPTAAQLQAESIRLQRESVARQKAVVRQQTDLAVAVPLPPPAAGCDPIGEHEVAPLIAAASTVHQVKPELLRAVIQQESAFRPCAISPKGAMGLMQLMPGTADRLQVSDPLDPAQNVHAGARYLKELLTRFGGDSKLALAAYNAGPGRVTGGEIPDIPETRDYVRQVLDRLVRLGP